jgi:hypothetical protein
LYKPAANNALDIIISGIVPGSGVTVSDSAFNRGECGDRFPHATATAMGIAITSGWAGLAASSRLIGVISSRYGGGVATGMVVLPVFSAILVILTVILSMVLRSASTNDSALSRPEPIASPTPNLSGGVH